MAHLRGAEKRRYVAEMFARISPRYDLMNSLMTGGMHHRWKRTTARLTTQGLCGTALDIATGTGDLAFALSERPGITAAVGVDLLPEMIALAEAKAAAGKRHSAKANFIVGDALRLPFADGTFCCATAGFSLRNMEDVSAAVNEMARVVSPGGRVTTLELTPMPAGWPATLGRVYFHKVVPLLGELVAGDRSAYTYLPSSVDYFLTADGLAEAFRAAGLTNVGYRRLGMGAVAIHYGEKPGR